MNYVRTTLLSLGLVTFIGSAATAGCSSDEPKSEEENIVPGSANNPFDQSAVCDQNLQRHDAVQQFDLNNGTVSWACKDVEGVDGGDRGQEYCEYMAISNGQRVSSFLDVDGTAGLQCFFTSYYYDFDGQGGVVSEADQAVATQLSSAENFGVAIDPNLVRMKGGVNSRGAANTLIRDCMAIASDVNEQRQAACYMASLNGNGEALREACRNVDLSVEANWAKAQELGANVAVQGDANYERQQNIAACVSTGRAAHGAATYRNSDPRICMFIQRASEECQCTYGDLPSDFLGFQFTGWTNDTVPTGCRRAVVDGEESKNAIICDVSQQQLEEIEFDLNYSENLDAFCNETFGTDIVMRAPVFAIEAAGSCQGGTPYCEQFPASVGGGGTGTDTGTDTGTGTATSTGCEFDHCSPAPAQTDQCNQCIIDVCAQDSFCCESSWDEQCVGLASTTCGGC